MKLSAEHISKSFEDGKVLDDISLFLEKGKIVAVVGASGVGKTTLFNIIAGTLLPDEGQVLLNDENITGRPGNVSYMPQ
ncbi:MAG: ATP-binding cassette domain-containing protein, partial [Firmicutes bacterium]|nr:ATP-binding cassette domain-containing protein [Bacillota bacterium]